VSRVIAQILGIRHAKIGADTTVYDPTCGSGSLLLKIGDEARHGHEDVKVTLYGQEKDNATAGLARMNMILHDYAIAEIRQGNTISNPLFIDGDALKTFDYVVANPPFSDKRWSTGLDAEHDPWQRFQHYGVPPNKQGDYAYLLHILHSLKNRGKGACILPHGVLFRGGAEAAIRRSLVQRGYLKGIIGLPPHLFYGTGIAACIVVLDKEGANARKSIFMIDASRGFIKDGNKNRLREQDIHKIVDIFNRQVELARYSRLVSVTEISSKNDYNLNLPRYIDSADPEDIQDIDGHLRGGIPDQDIDALDRYWRVIPGVRTALFKKAGRGGYSQLKLPIEGVNSTIFAHPEFTEFNHVVLKCFDKWKAAAVSSLKDFGKDDRPKALIEKISEDLLAIFRGVPLLDAYDVYQHMMDYWSETMQDDCYLIADDGWHDAGQLHLIVEEKGKKVREKPDFVLGKKKYQAELIPPTLVIGRWFADDQASVEKLEAEVAAFQQQMEEMAEEHGTEGGLLASAANDQGKLTKASVTAKLKEIKGDANAADEIKELKNYLALVEQDAAAAAELAKAQDALTEKVAVKYPKLTENEIKALVVIDKWLGALAAAVQGELDRVSKTLTSTAFPRFESYRHHSSASSRGSAPLWRAPQDEVRRVRIPPIRTDWFHGIGPLVASVNWRNATPSRCHSSPTKWSRSPPVWTDTLRGWEEYGSEGGLQAERRGCHP
jgi:type I restriction enzyme M protein